MRQTLLAISLSLASAGACAADAPQPQPAVTGGAIAAAKARGTAPARTAASPVVMQTSAVRMPDGSIAMVCEQKPNPKAGRTSINRPAPEPQQ